MSALNHRRILVIDDNQAIHDDFRKILGDTGASSDALEEAEAALFGSSAPRSRQAKFEIDSAFQGQEGLALVERSLETGERYAMAFVDVRMPPGWDGIETTDRIWNCDPEIQIVICTAYSEYSWDEMLAKLGHSDRLLILKKPFDNIEVLQVANALTEKWRLLQETKNQFAMLDQKVEERTRELQEANHTLELEIAERRKAEEALRQTQEMVLRQERLAVVGQLSAGVAHEFNNILTVIQGHATLLLNGSDLSNETAASLGDIASSAERAANLTRQMLAFSRKQIMHTKVLDLNDVVSHLAKMLQRLLTENIRLRCDYAPGLSQVRADAGMIEQIIMNLAINARDAMPTGGELKVSTQPVEIAKADLGEGERRYSAEAYEGNFIRLSVQDTGCGMDEATLKRIFEPFFTTKEVGKGTGLGLATVYGIVKQHDGWIEVSSEVGAGTRFDIYFPVAPASAATTIIDKPEASPIRGGNETVLIVEDEDAIRELLRVVLQRHGYRVLEAASGVEALQVWRQHSREIQILFTDMVMPEGLSGRELAEKLRQENPNLCVIYSSGYSEEMLGLKAWHEKEIFLSKPYQPAEIIRAIRDCLDDTQRWRKAG